MAVRIVGHNISITFKYDAALVKLVGSIPGRSLDWDTKVWSVPAQPWYAKEVIRLLKGKLTISEGVYALAEKVADNQPVQLTVEELSVDGNTPRPFQVAAVEFLDGLDGRGLICDDVGLGKTIETLLYLRYKKIKSFLVICPASVTYKWEAEIRKWYPEIIDISILGRDRRAAQVTITSYDLLIRYEDPSGTKNLLVREWKPQAVIVDEFHRIKNHKALRTIAVKHVSKGVPHVIGLSGTPLLNRPKELYNMLNLVDPAAWSWPNYMKRYAWTGSNYQGAVNLPELEQRLKTIMIRRQKREVMDQMPKFTRTYVHVDVDQTMYMKLNSGQSSAWLAQLGRTPKNELDTLQGLRQWLTRAKVEAAADWMEDFLDNTSEKLIVYCGFLEVVSKLEQKFAEYGVTKITGDVSQAERARIIMDWQTTNRKRLMLLTSAGGEGIDLFGKGEIQCSTILFVAREWGPAAEMQVEGRIDRMGQQYPVEAIYLVANMTIDEDINHLIEEKRRLLAETVGVYAPDVSILPDLLSHRR